jgi:hypothetical protein
MNFVLEWLPFALTWGLPFDGYLAMQIIVLIRCKGWWRLAALLPLPVMAYVVFLTTRLYSADSNLWPMYLIMVSIPAFVFLLILFLVERYRRRQS